MPKVTINNYKDDKYYPRVVEAVTVHLETENIVSPINLLSQMGLLKKSNIVSWKKGQIPFLEKSIECNLSKANRILRIFGFHAQECNLLPSAKNYKHKGKVLRFSKTKDDNIEKAYAKAYLRPRKKC